jgi:hypothetical protein
VYNAGILTIGGARFAVGRSGDVAAVGRWDCRAAGLALLRPQTGEVWVFERWPVGAEPVVATAVGRVKDATALSVEGTGRCATLLAVRGHGAAVQLTRGRP